MHSVDKQQPEPNHEDLSGQKAVDKLRELMNRAPTCFFCSAIRSGASFSTRPMSVQRAESDGTLLFLAPIDGQLVREVQAESAVQILCQGSSHSDFLTLYGSCTVDQDRALIRVLWEPILKTWFTEGVEDPRIAVLRVRPVSGYYWDTKHGRAVALAKMVVGAALGRTLDDSMQGRLDM